MIPGNEPRLMARRRPAGRPPAVRAARARWGAAVWAVAAAVALVWASAPVRALARGEGPEAALVEVRPASPRSLDSTLLTRELRRALDARAPFRLVSEEETERRLRAVGLRVPLVCGADACLAELAQVLGVSVVFVAELEDAPGGAIARLRQVDPGRDAYRAFEEPRPFAPGEASMALAADRLVDVLMGLRGEPVPAPAIRPVALAESGGDASRQPAWRRRLPWFLTAASATAAVLVWALDEDGDGGGSTSVAGDELPGPPPPPD